MSDNTIKKFKFFWHDQDEEQELWLREMARQGLHLAAVDVLCRWTFVVGAPADVVYRVDYCDKKRDSAYNRKIEDEGWECAADVTGYFYWRRPAQEARVQELFSDPELMIAKHKRKLATLALAILPLILMISSSWRGMPFPFVFSGFLALAVPLYAYIVARLVRRIAALRRHSNLQSYASIIVSAATVSKYKWFWFDQDLEQEQWLRAMAREGLHLAGVTIFRWTFVKGEPADVVYRVDYSGARRDSHYNRLLEDALWQCATTSAGWQYWRRAAIAGSVQEIFTDSASKVDRFRNVLLTLILLGWPSAVLLGHAGSSLSPPSLVLMVSCAAFFLYIVVRLLMRIGRLHQAA